MNKQQLKKRLEAEAARLTKKYGEKAGALGSARWDTMVVPTGSLSLDYALGTGGWQLGRITHLYGEPDIGKSSTLGLAAFRNAQAMGLTTGLIAVEPGFDPDWAVKNGVDTDLLVIARPDDGEEALNILYEWVTGDLVDFIILDSVGGIVNPFEAKVEGVAQMGGASNLITMGIRRILMPTWKFDKGLILLNQVRDDMKSRFGGVKPPGGRLLTHAADVWVHLRQSSGGPDAVRKVKDDGEDIIVGRNLTAHITRNKLCEGTGNKAKFWYNQMTTEEYGPVGIDTTSDIIATGLRTGAIRRDGAIYSHETFPSGKFRGRDSVDAFLLETPQAVKKIREEVLIVMRQKATPTPHVAPDLEAFDRAIEAA